MIKWGILGLGTMANNFAVAIKETSNAKLLAISSLDKNKLSNFSKKFNIDNKYAYNKYEDLLKLNEIDAVYISTLNNTHLDLIVKSAQNKKHILCEKPFVMNFNEAQVAFEHIKKESVFFMEAIAYRSHPQTKEILNIIDNNEIGKINAIESSFGFKAKVRPESRLYNKKLGGGAILDVGCYPVSFLTMFEKTYGKINIENSKINFSSTNVDDFAELNLKVGQNIEAKIKVSIKENLKNTSVIYGENGRIIIPSPWLPDKKSFMEIYLKERNYKKFINIDRSIYANQISVVSDLIKHNFSEAKFPLLNLEESLKVSKLLDDWTKNKN